MTADTRPLAIALMGPTASGKTALALDWAQRFGGEIVSVDSALVYRGLDIGAAKPSDEERVSVPHHLIDVREPWQPYSAADFANDARATVDGIVARGRLPILAGGTGLYFRALLQGLSPMPEADPAIRAQLTAEADERGWPAMHAELGRIDPAAAARIHVNDPQRIQRALEVYRLSGRSISDWQRETIASAQRFPCRVLKVAVAPRDRSVLHARIERRFDANAELQPVMPVSAPIAPVAQTPRTPRRGTDRPSTTTTTTTTTPRSTMRATTMRGIYTDPGF